MLMNVDTEHINVILLLIARILRVHMRRVFKLAPVSDKLNDISIAHQFEMLPKCSCKRGFEAYYSQEIGGDRIETNFGPILTTQMPDQLCRDLDECSLKTHKCHKDATCYNKEGSYRCRCKS